MWLTSLLHLVVLVRCFQQQRISLGGFTLLICSATQALCQTDAASLMLRVLELACWSWEPLYDAAVSGVHTLPSVDWNSTVTQMATPQCYVVHKDAYVVFSFEYQCLRNQTLRTGSTIVWFRLMLLLVLIVRQCVLTSLLEVWPHLKLIFQNGYHNTFKLLTVHVFWLQNFLFPFC